MHKFISTLILILQQKHFCIVFGCFRLWFTVRVIEFLFWFCDPYLPCHIFSQLFPTGYIIPVPSKVPASPFHVLYLYFPLPHFPPSASKYLSHPFFSPSLPQTHQCFFWVQTCICISQCYLYVNSSSQIFTIGPSGETQSQGWDDSTFVNKNHPRETLLLRKTCTEVVD